MRRSAVLVVSVSALWWVFPGCVVDHASAIAEGEFRFEPSKPPDKPPNPEDPFGSCADHTDDGVHQTTCSIPGLDCWGWGFVEGCIEGECGGVYFWETCRHQCEQTSDCPVPITGDAVPACVAPDEHCVLPCDEATVCPDGFICVNPSVIDADPNSLYGDSCVQYNSYDFVDVP